MHYGDMIPIALSSRLGYPSPPWPVSPASSFAIHRTMSVKVATGGKGCFWSSGARNYALYRDLMAERCKVHGIVCLAYCLMPNHVHLLLQPPEPDSLSRAAGEAHQSYTAYVNARARVTGHVLVESGHWATAHMPGSHRSSPKLCVQPLACC